MIDFHTYHQIHDLHYRQHLSFSEISQKLSLNSRTVIKWAEKKRYESRQVSKRSSILDPFKPAIRQEVELTQCSAAHVFQNLKELSYGGGYTIVKQFISHFRQDSCDAETVLPGRWMLMLLQGKITAKCLVRDLGEKLSLEDAETLITHIREGKLRERNRAITVIADLRGIPISQIVKFLMIGQLTVKKILGHYCEHGIRDLFSFRKESPRKHEQAEYKDALFAILHSPPSDYGINRTSWKMPDLHRIMREQGQPLNKDSIRKIIRDAGFRFRKAKKVLTSTDSRYREKLESITKILANLSESECFFSIDEFGPFAIKMRGGKALTGPEEQRIIPQWQKSKGSLILTGALELATNQITHFYSDHKNTAEMITLLNILLTSYKNKQLLYFSWDAASWHGSKELEKEVKRVNADNYRSVNGTPEVVLAPLPSSAQFLNVIESVFSGMARAIIHNSDYQSSEECKLAIDRYFEERNQLFKRNPKRAGKKIWGKEREKAVFSESNNCKDPMYR